MSEDGLRMAMRRQAVALREVAANDNLLEVGRQAIQEALIEFRESHLSMPRGNGLGIKEKDGKDPYVLIRMGPEDGLRIGLTAIAKHLVEASEHSAKTTGAEYVDGLPTKQCILGALDRVFKGTQPGKGARNNHETA